MFGGYGIKIYDGPHYPGLPPRLLLTLIEDHLPSPTFWDHIAGEAKTPNKTPGGGRTDAWELFTQYTHTERNQELLKMFDLEPSRERSHYDY